MRSVSPLAKFIAGRFVTMLALLFLLGLAMFGLMELAPGDIVDQMMTQQIMAGAAGEGGGKGGEQNERPAETDAGAWHRKRGRGKGGKDPPP